MTRRRLLQGAVALPAATKSWVELARSHLDRLIENGLDVYAQVHTPMWMASLDIASGTYPEKEPFARAGKRVYRDIAAPFGSTIYWDQPQLVAAHALSGITGDPRYGEAADNYVRSFLDRCIDENGLFQWGNHRYYDAFRDEAAQFAGGWHEIRPISPAWALFWKHSPDATERQILQASRRHVFDPETGGFNRHDNGKRNMAFLEAGAVLAESLSWLANKTGNHRAVELALRIARFSYGHRSEDTGLVENNPTVTRWDKHVCTTEVGLWAGCLLRCADLSGDEEFANMAEKAVAAWLRSAWDKKAGRYYGQLRVSDGSPVLEGNAVPGPEEYFPGHYTNIWNANFPAHDYALAMAETCLELSRRTGKEIFGEAVRRWTRVIDETPIPDTASHGRGGYAELFGRSVHFLVGASEMQHARRLAAAAERILFTQGMFRGHAGEDRYDAVDGVGYLLLALLYLESGQRANYMGFGF